MNRKTIAAAFMLAALGALSVEVVSAGTADAATATPPKSLSQWQAAGAAAIAARQATLTTTLVDVQANTEITSADRASLVVIVTHDQTGLATLGQKLAADTTVTSAAADYHAIFLNFRVYALAVPQAHLASAADTITVTVRPALSDAQTTLQAALRADPAKNTAAVQRSMTDLAARLTDISAKTDGLSSTVLADTPAEYDANHALLASARSALLAADSDTSAARADITSVLAAMGAQA